MASIDYRSPDLRQWIPSAPTASGRRSAITPPRYPLGVVGAVIMLVFVFAAIFADVHHGLRSDQRPIRRSRCAPPSHGHLLGADQMGRDIYSRIVYGARISLAVGLGSTLLGCLFGVVLGLTSGYLGGWVDLVIQRIVDVLQAVPLLVLALVMAAALGPGARQHHRRHRHPADSLYRARHPLQHADVARTALRRSGARRRHERIPHRGAPRAAQYAGAADRASPPRSSARRS